MASCASPPLMPGAGAIDLRAVFDVYATAPCGKGEACMDSMHFVSETQPGRGSPRAPHQRL